MKTDKHIILESKFVQSKFFKAAWDAIKGDFSEFGIEEQLGNIKGAVAKIAGAIKSDTIKDAAKKGAANEEDEYAESVSVFNKLYTKLLLEADDKKADKKEDKIDSGTSSDGEVIYLKVDSSGSCTILDKDKKFDPAKFNDETLNELRKQIKIKPEKFKPDTGDEIFIKSGAATKADKEADEKENSGKKEYFSVENITGEYPSALDELDNEWSVDSAKVVEIAKANVDAFSKNLLKRKHLVKAIDPDKIEDKKAFGAALFSALCAGVYAKAIRAAQAAEGKSKKDAQAAKDAIKNVFEGFSPYNDIVIPGFCKGHRGFRLKNDISLVDTTGKAFNLTCSCFRRIKSDEDLGLLAHTLAQGIDGKRDVDPASYIKALEIIKDTVKPALGWANHSVEQKQNLNACLTKCDELIDKLKPLVKK